MSTERVAPVPLPAAIETSTIETSTHKATQALIRHTFGDSETTHDTAIMNLALLPFITGTEPNVRQVELDHTGSLDGLVPPMGIVERRYDSKDESVVLSTGDGWTAIFERRSWSEKVYATISARTVALIDEVASHLNTVAPQQVADATKLAMRMWHYSKGDASSLTRKMETPSWASISDNYPTAVRNRLEELRAFNRPQSGGRLMLWHGEPGTGKTTAIRCLAQSWSDWAVTEYVTDSDRLFEHSDYLFTVLTRNLDDRDQGKVRLVVVEDADQFLAVNARRETGSGLARLLNLTDGIVGQGLDAIVLITTNEPIGRLHPAIVRPGRCLANIEFARFTKSQAATWLGLGAGEGVGDIDATGATLAELYELRDKRQVVHRKPPAGSGGQYL